MKLFFAAFFDIFKSVSHFLTDILFPDACCLCREIKTGFFLKEKFLFSDDGRSFPTQFCENCTRQLEKAFGPWEKEEYSPQADAEFLLDYSYETVRLLLFHIKKRKCNCCNLFISELIFPYFEKSKNDRYRVTYIPRNRINFAKYGVDQSKIIVKKQLEKGNISEYCEIFVRKNNFLYGKPQKTLDPIRRMANAKNTLFLSPSCTIPKKLLVFDDMITTGATSQTARDLVVSKRSDCDIKFLFLAGTP